MPALYSIAYSPRGSTGELPKAATSKPVALFRQRAFARYWLAGMLNNTGTWLQNVVAAVLVYQLTGSAFFVGVFGFVSFLPLLVLSLPAGVLSDRVDRRRIVVLTHLVAATAAATAAIGLWAGQASWMLITAVAFTTQAAYALAKPALVSMLPSLVPRPQLTEATAVATMQFSIGQLVGPLLASLFLVVEAPGLAFAVNAVTFLIPVWAMRSVPRQATTSRGDEDVRRAMLAGMGHVWSHRAIRATLVAVLAVGFFGEVIRTASPLVAVDLLHQPTAFAGVLIALSSLGSVAGLLAMRFVPFFRSMAGAGLPILGFTCVGTGIALLLAMPQVMGVAGVVILGFGHALAFTSSTAYLHGVVDDSFRGRVMSIHTLAHLGARPATALIVVSIAAALGPGAVLLASLLLVPIGMAASWEARHSDGPPAALSADASAGGLA